MVQYNELMSAESFSDSDLGVRQQLLSVLYINDCDRSAPRRMRRSVTSVDVRYQCNWYKGTSDCVLHLSSEQTSIFCLHSLTSKSCLTYRYIQILVAG